MILLSICVLVLVIICIKQALHLSCLKRRYIALEQATFKTATELTSLKLEYGLIEHKPLSVEEANEMLSKFKFEKL
ncbi:MULTISPECIES: hypothetical protein [unclassified Klebsiella]|uniref:hypothetical protein n=1 Tax=unclassified Klebsiella TaxID=2608929 RepID=UPI0010568957|nr:MULTISPECIES: hypothetical protein [unclassified Klebsiella]